MPPSLNMYLLSLSSCRQITVKGRKVFDIDSCDVNPSYFECVDQKTVTLNVLTF